jgi:hypothetical protein
VIDTSAEDYYDPVTYDVSMITTMVLDRDERVVRVKNGKYQPGRGVILLGNGPNWRTGEAVSMEFYE